MFYATSKALAWVTSPALWSVALLGGAVLASRRPRAAAALALLAAAVAGGASSPAVANGLRAWLGSTAPRSFRPEAAYDAAIVLSGDDARVAGAAEVVRRAESRHLLYTGWIDRRSAEVLRQRLRARGIPDDAIVVASSARNTRENALEAYEVAARHGWRKLLLVTSADHVPRALACFRRVGLDPDVLPVEPQERTTGAVRWMPSRAALETTRAVVHELIGILAYRLAGYA